MTVLSGGDLILPDRVVSPGTLVIHDGRIADLSARVYRAGPGERDVVDLSDHYVLPGFIDVHVHGLEGHDALDEGPALGSMANRMPAYGVVAFAPTSVACAPPVLRAFLKAVREARLSPAPGAARVLPAHLESNFLNPEYRGAQPLECLRRPRFMAASSHASFTADDILSEISQAEPDVGIVTLAPELEGGLDLVGRLIARGHRVSLGHSAATFEQAGAAIELGARHATHLFNRMPRLHHRDPGLAGAVLTSDAVTAEIICDGIHVHPAIVRLTVAARPPESVLAITDGTAGAGLAEGARATLGGRPIVVRNGAAYLDPETLAGSAITMDAAFRMLAGPVGLSVVEAARLCATNPARALNLGHRGLLAVNAAADLVVLDRAFRVRQTYVDGTLVYER